MIKENPDIHVASYKIYYFFCPKTPCFFQIPSWFASSSHRFSTNGKSPSDLRVVGDMNPRFLCFPYQTRNGNVVRLETRESGQYTAYRYLLVALELLIFYQNVLERNLGAPEHCNICTQPFHRCAL